ncbi:YggS family pyridoxal phosphate-dependent enzyme [Magnetospira thiophila]
MIAQTDVAGNLQAIRQQIAQAQAEARRPAGAVDLVAVSKTHPPSVIRAALEAGQRIFGENRIQEAAEKWPQLREDYTDVRLHLIGPLQTNKTAQAVALFDVIETLDRPKLARYLARALSESGRAVNFYVQVNTGEEAQKAGVQPDAADAFIRSCREEYQLPVRGLMCIPPQDEEPALHFALLAQIAERNGLEKLSMGMSGDFPIAIRFGATSVRIGTAIFGGRPPLTP